MTVDYRLGCLCKYNTYKARVAFSCQYEVALVDNFAFSMIFTY